MKAIAQTHEHPDDAQFKIGLFTKGMRQDQQQQQWLIHQLELGKQRQ